MGVLVLEKFGEGLMDTYLNANQIAGCALAPEEAVRRLPVGETLSPEQLADWRSYDDESRACLEEYYRQNPSEGTK